MANKYAEYSKVDEALEFRRQKARKRGSRVCLIKKRFASAENARDWADRHGFGYQRVYKCPMCTGYHLTTKPE